MNTRDTYRSIRVRLRLAAGAAARLPRRLSARARPLPGRAAAAARRLRDRLAETFTVERLTLYAFTLADTESTPHPGNISSEFRLINADRDGLDRLKKQHPSEFTDRKHGILRDRLSDNGEECYLVEDNDGNLCGYCHVALRDTLNARINYPVKLDPTEIYFYDDHTFRPHRRRGVHTFSIAERARRMHERGSVTGVTIISDSNTASISSYRQFGARPRRFLFHVTRLRRTISYSTTSHVSDTPGT